MNTRTTIDVNKRCRSTRRRCGSANLLRRVRLRNLALEGNGGSLNSPEFYGLITYCLLSWLLLSRRCWGVDFAVTSETTGSSCILDFLKRFIYLRPKKTNLPTHLSFGRASGTFNFYALKLGIISFTLIYTITSIELSSPVFFLITLPTE